MPVQESLFHKALIVCPQCSSEEDATIWDCINASSDPDLKDRLLRKTLQNHVCSNCGLDFAMAEPLVYYDPKQLLLIAVLPGSGERPDIDFSRLDRLAEAACGFVPTASDGYSLRLVDDYNQMIEKIHLSDHGRNDRLMEIVKIAVRKNPVASAPPSGIDALFYLSEEQGDLSFLARGKDGAWYQMILPDDIYNNTERLLGETLRDDGKWVTVDAAYAVEAINRLSAMSGQE